MNIYTPQLLVHPSGLHTAKLILAETLTTGGVQPPLSRDLHEGHTVRQAPLRHRSLAYLLLRCSPRGIL